MAATKYFRFLFGQAGTRLSVPDVAPVDGTVSYENGWGPDYAEDLNTEPTALPIPRPQSNQLLYDLTQGLQQYQQIGIPNFISSSDNGGTPYSYAKYSLCLYDVGGGLGPQIWRSTDNSNTTTPGAVGNKWVNAVTSPLSWVSTWAYQLNDFIVYGPNIYYSLVGGNVGNQPDISAAQWRSVDYESIDDVLNGSYFVDVTSSPPNPTVNYTAGRNNGFALPTQIITGTTIDFQPLHTNDANPTLKVPTGTSSGTAYPILHQFTLEPIEPGTLKGSDSNGGVRYTLTYLSGSGWVLDQGSNFNIANAQSPKTGMGVSVQEIQDVPDPDDVFYQVTVNTGNVWDTTGQFLLSLNSAIIKKANSPWAEGNNENGAVIALPYISSTFVYVFIIREDSTGQIDVIIDTSSIAANRPSGWTYFRCLGLISTTNALVPQLIGYPLNISREKNYTTCYSAAMGINANMAVTLNSSTLSHSIPFTVNFPSEVEQCQVQSLSKTSSASANSPRGLSSFTEIDSTFSTYDFNVQNSSGDANFVTSRTCVVNNGETGTLLAQLTGVVTGNVNINYSLFDISYTTKIL